MPTNNAQVIKMPLGTYEFGANLVSNQVAFVQCLSAFQACADCQLAMLNCLSHFLILLTFFRLLIRCYTSVKPPCMMGGASGHQLTIAFAASCVAGEHHGRSNSNRRQDDRSNQVRPGLQLRTPGACSCLATTANDGAVEWHIPATTAICCRLTWSQRDSRLPDDVAGMT